MKRAHYLIVGLLAFASCRQHSDTEDAQARALIATLDNSNKFISTEIKTSYTLFQDKYHDVRSAEMAAIWLPRVNGTKRVSEEMLTYVDSIKTSLQSQPVYELFEKSGKKKDLLRKIAHWHKNILDVWAPDSLLAFSGMDKEAIKSRIVVMVTNVSQDLVQRFDPGNTTTAMVNVMLDQIENDLLLTEHRILSYAHLHCSYIDDGYDRVSVLMGSNSMYLKAGQTLTISAGIGFFSVACDPIITINGRPVKLNEGGVAEYSTIVSHHAGKHSIPVKFEYTRPDGSTSTFTKDAKYEIAP